MSLLLTSLVSFMFPKTTNIVTADSRCLNIYGLYLTATASDMFKLIIKPILKIGILKFCTSSYIIDVLVF